MWHVTIAIDKAAFITTDLKKHASYADEMFPGAEKRPNFDADLKPDRNFTAVISTRRDQKLQLSVYFTACALVISFKTTANLHKS